MLSIKLQPGCGHGFLARFLNALEIVARLVPPR